MSSGFRVWAGEQDNQSRDKAPTFRPVHHQCLLQRWGQLRPGEGELLVRGNGKPLGLRQEESGFN